MPLDPPCILAPSVAGEHHGGRRARRSRNARRRTSTLLIEKKNTFRTHGNELLETVSDMVNGLRFLRMRSGKDLVRRERWER